MVGTLAQFDPKYRALEETVLDSTDMEASSVVNFNYIKEEGVFHANPAHIDALSQSAGFVMNANDRSDLEVEVFVNHGWSAFHLFEKSSPLKSCQTHVAMVEHSGKMSTGDILVLDGNKILASFGGIAVSLSNVPEPLKKHCELIYIDLHSLKGFLSTRCSSTPSPLRIFHGKRGTIRNKRVQGRNDSWQAAGHHQTSRS